VEYRPYIWVRVLPALENGLFGANVSNLLSANKYAILDILAWLPYGILHFAAPFLCSLTLFQLAAPGTTPVFAHSFGWMNILGVTIQLLFPCTPPWYENEHGLVPAMYGMSGSPAGLARIDEIFGVDMYTTSFTNAPLPFGAFPSLHAANAVLEALFLTYCFPRTRIISGLYVAWIFWATMYLSHHYAIDLIGGLVIAVAIFLIARGRYIPVQQSDRFSRWEYDYVEVGHRWRGRDEEYGEGIELIESDDAWISEDERSVGGQSSTTYVSTRSSTDNGLLSPKHTLPPWDSS
jgi:inositol phosphorylceramide synthase catalytic subunit